MVCVPPNFPIPLLFLSPSPSSLTLLLLSPSPTFLPPPHSSSPPPSPHFVTTDLSLGDTHVVAIDDLMSRDKGKDLVGDQNLCLSNDGRALAQSFSQSHTASREWMVLLSSEVQSVVFQSLVIHTSLGVQIPLPSLLHMHLPTVYTVNMCVHTYIHVCTYSQAHKLSVHMLTHTHTWTPTHSHTHPQGQDHPHIHTRTASLSLSSWH